MKVELEKITREFSIQRIPTSDAIEALLAEIRDELESGDAVEQLPELYRLWVASRDAKVYLSQSKDADEDFDNEVLVVETPLALEDDSKAGSVKG
jgi:hypothetical protein